MGATTTMAVIEALTSSGLGDLLKQTINKGKDHKTEKLKATLEIITTIVDEMNEEGMCDGRKLIKELVGKKHIFGAFNDEEYGD